MHEPAAPAIRAGTFGGVAASMSRFPFSSQMFHMKQDNL